MIRRNICLGFFFILLMSCSHKNGQVNTKTITVSIPPQAYFIQRLAGAEYQVFVLVPPGMGPETYEPSPGDLEKVSNSTFCFFSGYLDFENQLAEKLRSWKKGPVMIDLSDYVDVITDSGHGGEGNMKEVEGHHHVKGVDPHYWMSPKEMKKVTDALCNILTEKNPAEKALYEKNRESLIKDIITLDSTLRIDFKDLKTRKFILFHPSLTYFSRDYNLEQLSMEQGGKQPSTHQIATLVDAAEKEGIHTVFLQSQFDVNNMETLAKEIKGKLVSIDPLSSDWLTNMYLIANKLKEAMHGK